MHVRIWNICKSQKALERIELLILMGSDHLNYPTRFTPALHEQLFIQLFLYSTLHVLLFISTEKRCSYNCPIQRSQPNPIPIQSNHPTYSSRAEKGQTEQDQNAGVRLTRQNCDFMNNLFRKKNFCRTMRKFTNCIKTLGNLSIKPGIASKHNWIQPEDTSQY